MPLSDTAIRNAKPKSKPYKLYDSGGLFVIVTPVGGKWWRLKYRIEGKEKLLSLGTYPETSLKEAREKRDEARKLIAQGIDPSVQRQAKKAAAQAEEKNTFEIVAREWVAKRRGSWSESRGKRVLAWLENDIFPFIRGRVMASITAPELLDVLRRIEARGAVYVAHRAKQTCGQIWRYAFATGRVERDITADLKGALAPAKSKNFASITEPKAVGILLRDMDAYGGYLIVRFALRMAPYVFVRPGELQQAEWTEFNFEGKEWRIPAAKMKMKQVHIVPLARQVISMLQELQPYTGNGRFLFPSPRANSAPITKEALLAGLRRLGYTKEQMTVHGFRSMASTLLNEKGFNRDWIERQLAHGDRDGVRAAYNYAEYLPERRKMMQWWADYLDELRKKKE
ncbi:MAG: integrase arm-type DNA-binding domain-containing protein [Cystobacterineae bacterium]|nr:integrase arm-type DNA-binding domain-containing protein [Cystobacterineae bacterium]